MTILSRTLACLLLTGALTTEAAVLCGRQRPNGTFNTTVKIREQCRSNEVTLNAAQLGLQGPAGRDGAAQVVDATGRPFGTVLAASHCVSGLFSVGGHSPYCDDAAIEVLHRMSDGTPVTIPMVAGRAFASDVYSVNDDFQIVVFAGDGCTGQPYFQTYYSPDDPRAQMPMIRPVVTKGSVVYYPVGELAQQPLTAVRSQLYMSAEMSEATCLAYTASGPPLWLGDGACGIPAVLDVPATPAATESITDFVEPFAIVGA